MKASPLNLKCILVCILLLLVSCTATQPPGQNGTPGFWLGIWHGFSTPVTFFISLFTDIRIYAFPNAGKWYDLGFLIGMSVWSGGGTGAACRRKKTK